MPVNFEGLTQFATLQSPFRQMALQQIVAEHPQNETVLLPGMIHQIVRPPEVELAPFRLDALPLKRPPGAVAEPQQTHPAIDGKPAVLRKISSFQMVPRPTAVDVGVFESETLLAPQQEVLRWVHRSGLIFPGHRETAGPECSLLPRRGAELAAERIDAVLLPLHRQLLPHHFAAGREFPLPAPFGKFCSPIVVELPQNHLRLGLLRPVIDSAQRADKRRLPVDPAVARRIEGKLHFALRRERQQRLPGRKHHRIDPHRGIRAFSP